MNGYYAKRFFGKVKTPIVGYNFNGQTLDQYGTLNQTLYGGATITGDKLNVTASGQYAQSLDPTGVASFGSGAFSISGKILLNNIIGNQPIAYKRDDLSVINGAKAEWQVRFTNGKLTIFLFDSSKSTDSNIRADSTMTFSQNTNYHLTITFGGGVGNLFKMYVNGVLIPHTYTTTGNYTQMRNNGSALRLGAEGWVTTLALLGSLDDFKLFNIELTADEVVNL